MTSTSNPPKFPEEPNRTKFVSNVIPSTVRELDQGYRKYSADFSNWVTDEFNRRMPDEETKHEVLLTNPDGKVYSIQVDAAGAIVATLVRNP